MNEKLLLKHKRKSKESWIDKLLNRIMIISLFLFLAVTIITVVWVLWDMVDWNPTPPQR